MRPLRATTSRDDLLGSGHGARYPMCLSIAYMYSFYYFGALLPHAHPSPRHPHPGFRTGRTAMMPRIETRRRALPSVCGAAAPLAKYVIEV